MDATIFTNNGTDRLSIKQDALSGNSEKSIQDELFDRVVTLLAEKGVGVEGKGGIALDLRSDGSIEVIGNIANKQEIEGALGNDAVIAAIIKQNDKQCSISQQNSGKSFVDSLEISAEAITAYEDFSDGQDIQTVSEEDKKQAFVDLLGLGQGISSSIMDSTSLDWIAEQLNKRIEKVNEELSNTISEALLLNGLDIDAAEEMEFLIGDNGEIVVESSDESIKGSEARREVEEALNSDKKIQESLVHSFKQLDLDQRSLLQFADLHAPHIDYGLPGFKKVEDGPQINEIADQLLVDLSEYKYGTSTEKLTEDSEFEDKNLQKILTEISSNQAADEDVGMDHVGTTFTLKGGVFDSVNLQEAKKNNITNYDNHIKAVMQQGLESIKFDPICNFEAVISNDGKVEIVGGEDTAGNKFDHFMIDKALTVLNTVDPDGSRISLITDQIIEDHDMEHGDTEEYNHFIRLNVDAYQGCSFEVFSPEADKAAGGELEQSLQSITTELNENLETKGVLNPVEVMVNEEGKLEADTSALTDGEEDIVVGIIKDLNKEIDSDKAAESEKDSTANEVEEEEVEGRSKREIEEENESKKKELAQFKEDTKNKELDSLSRQVSVNNGTEYGKESVIEQEVIDSLKDKVAHSTGEDIEDSVVDKISALEDSGNYFGGLPSSLKGLEGVLEMAKGLNDILSKFHNHESLLAAIK